MSSGCVKEVWRETTGSRGGFSACGKPVERAVGGKALCRLHAAMADEHAEALATRGHDCWDHVVTHPATARHAASYTCGVCGDLLCVS